MTNSEENKDEEISQTAFSEGIDYYFENGLMVLTEHFLRKRGYCCKNGCRHCPYQKENTTVLQEKGF